MIGNIQILILPRHSCSDLMRMVILSITKIGRKCRIRRICIILFFKCSSWLWLAKKESNRSLDSFLFAISFLLMLWIRWRISFSVLQYKKTHKLRIHSEPIVPNIEASLFVNNFNTDGLTSIFRTHDNTGSFKVIS
jgi:hypothetical protein